MKDILSAFTLPDTLALAWFILCWVGYGWLSEYSQFAKKALPHAMNQRRYEWAARVLERDNRIVDSSLVGNLLRSVGFYANTTIYIIAALLAAMGTLDHALNFTAELPFARVTSRALLDMKLLLLLCIFVIAYFKFTWSLRQFNILSILIGAAPIKASESETKAAITRIGHVHAMAGDEFNRGIRAYYFGIAAATWFIQPWVFMVVSAFIVWVLYRRDFTSPALDALENK